MKFNGNLALRSFATLALCVACVNAYAADGLLGLGLLGNKSASSNDVSFFAGHELSFGNMVADSYASSALAPSYGECASCAGNAAAPEPAPFVAGGDVFFGEPVYDFGYDFGFDYVATYSASRPFFAPVRAAVRTVGGALRGIRDFLFGYGYSYCQPAYVCDPCWSVCDPCWSPCVDFCDPCAATFCDPCAPACAAPVCDPCAPTSVYAPASCCGNGYAPGQTAPYDPETGLANRTGFEGQDAPSKTTEPTPAKDPETSAPALPTYDDLNGLPPTNLSAPETVPTPDSNSGAGVIKMLVPENAIVYVNGYRTKQKGAVRSFAAKNLEFGETYSFEIRVVEMRNGQVYEDVQTTTLTAGDTSALAFNLTLRDNQAYAVR